ncbi:polysaccharide biosynthesis protein [Pelomonas sp. CA6]|uniref:polysaccharide biosynthesis protein n=1 Tax=Pelomonas sp. CA6 TaxID=2907999 RepID=UPI001F4BE0EA|nr:nucleoside-diphosphate sugar epimerase/dehydratase [Pelomonas sp. CA6]MCH7344416.1 polysaccharide biosynthesis protein [Pelomonas sp. CA6]
MTSKTITHFLALPASAKVALMVGGDAVFLPICMFLSVAMRLGSFELALDTALPLQLGIAWLAIPILAVAGLYRTVVRYIDLKVLLASSVALAAAVLIAYGVAFAFDFSVFPRSVLPSFWFVAFTYVVNSRFIVRSMLRRNLAGRRRVNSAIYGAGEAGVQLARAMQFSTEYRPVCFFDDARSLQRKSVSALPVHSPQDIREIAARYDIDEIVIAVPSATPTQKREMAERAGLTGLPVKILPALFDWVGGGSLANIRDLDVADLLGRDAVPPDPRLIRLNVTGKVVMVTGAGGSIGSELCRQVLAQKPSSIVLLDHSEFALYSIEQELKLQAVGTGIKVQARLGSVLNAELLDHILSTEGVQTVYHAAAYKHVPIVEENVQQGVQNNVFGSLQVAQACARAEVETCILISTDKAVRPTNAMGASKRVAELIFQGAALTSTRTRFAMVRFGNVLGSSGSVVPLFRQQIMNGGPITITHPDIIRYFMLIPEAAQLVIQAGAMATGGEVFVLDMGEPVRIADLARSMIRLSGLTERTDEHPEGDIEIKAVGLRPGEKLYEELLIGDDIIPSGHSRVMCARERHIEPSLLEKMLASLQAACVQNDRDGILRQLSNLVPEFRAANVVNAEMISRMQQQG